MVREPLLLICVCFFAISLNIFVSGSQLVTETDDEFGIHMLDILQEESELVDSLDETILQENTKLCSSNSDCFHGGNCTKNGTCSCPIGTNGTLCENAVECLEHPDMCGNGTNVKCIFDVRSKSTHCQCTEKKKAFDYDAEKCAEPCKSQYKNGTAIKKDCGIYGRCIRSFCKCVIGVSGDMCETIDECKDLDCGKDVTCSLGINGAYCKCKKAYQVYDEKEKACKGEPCKNNTDCLYNGECTDDGTCSCPFGTYGTFCQDVRECIENPKRCGNGTDVKCIFNVYNKDAYCSCDEQKKSFNNFTKKCAEPCEKYINHKIVREKCGMYGRCRNTYCYCVPGVSGDRCEIIDQCASGEVDCSGDPTATCSLGIEGAYCKCNKTYQLFDHNEKLCKGEPCAKNSDCMYGGNCTDDGTCSCPKGVLGPLCQQVFECEKNKDMCGNGTDVKCVFNTFTEKAVCKCDDAEKGFDKVEKKCRKECEHDVDCGLYGSCSKTGFCRCLKGVIGDYCETIEKCQNMDCSGEANCTLGSDGEALCKCHDSVFGYDDKSKSCKACECGDNSVGCTFNNGEKKCECAINYFRNGDKCQACNCGELSMGCELRDGKKECFCPSNYTTIGDTCQKCTCGIGSHHCKMEDGKTKCLCFELYKQRINKCEFCDCGIHDGNCSFSESGEKQCDCNPGFKMAKETGFCTEMCNDTKKCQNGGVCQDGVCKCHEDYGGAWCQTPKWCMNSRCGKDEDKVECIWDAAKREGRCECEKFRHIYDERDRSCTECDCGYYGNCIITERGEKVCICDKGYADRLLKCKRCDCGSLSTNCSFDYLGEKLCQCPEKHKQRNRKPYWGDETISDCSYCDCGENGACRFDGENKVCDCKANYKVFNGICKECNCGPYGFCSFDRDGNKVCTCDYSYSVRDGQCESCDCEPPKMRGIGTVCLLGGSKKECHCPRGYESPKNDFCEDINECLNSTSCPPNTDCENLPGSYKCQCKKGFKVSSLDLDPKKFGCDDINECWEYPCTGSNTVCVNTPGSYDCQCENGYYPTSATSGKYYNPKYTTCNKAETQWRSASIALGVVLSIGIIAVGSYLYNRRKGSRR